MAAREHVIVSGDGTKNLKLTRYPHNGHSEGEDAGRLRAARGWDDS